MQITHILPYSCKTQRGAIFQDQRYGPNMRLHNRSAAATGRGVTKPAEFRCTVCGTKKAG